MITSRHAVVVAVGLFVFCALPLGAVTVYVVSGYIPAMFDSAVPGTTFTGPASENIPSFLLAQSASFRPHTSLLYIAGTGGVLVTEDMKDDSVTVIPMTVLAAYPAQAPRIAFDPVSGRLIAADYDGHSTVVNPDTASELTTADFHFAAGDPNQGGAPRITSIAFSPDGTLYAARNNPPALLRVGNPGAGSAAANDGTLHTIGSLPAGATIYMIKFADNGDAYLCAGSQLGKSFYRLDVQTATTSLVGTIPISYTIEDIVIPPAPVRSLPVTGRVAGANGSLFRSDIRLANATAFPATATLDYYAAGGASAAPTASSTVEVDAYSQIALDDVLSTRFGVAAGSGAVRVRTIEKMAVSARIYNDQRSSGKGTFGQFVRGALDAESLSAGILPFISFEPAADGTGFRSNIGWFNPTSGDVHATFGLHTMSGDDYTSVTRTLKPFEQGQLAVNALFAAAPAQMENATITVQTDHAGIFVYASVVDNVSGDAIFVSAFPR